MPREFEYKYLLVGIYTVVLFLDRLDLSIVNITLPTLAKTFHASIQATQWVSTAFLLALAISIPISGWLGDRFGVKKIFMLAIALYGLGSALCAFAPNISVVIGLRFIQGLGGGMIIPVGMAMVYRAFPCSEYAHITTITFIPSLLAPAIAPFFGGLMLELWGWQSVFLIVGPICLAAIVASFFIIKEHKYKVGSLDWGGFVLTAAFLGLLLYAISTMGKDGLTTSGLILLGLALCLVSVLILHERQSTHPLINLNFFKSHLFVQANLIQLAFQICHYGAVFLIALYLQVGIGFTAVTSGLVLGLQALGAMLSCRYSGKLFKQYGPSLPLTFGLLGLSVITPLILYINDPSQAILGASMLFVRGIFVGLCGAAIQTSSIIDFDKSFVGRVSAIFNATRQISISLGLCLSSLFVTYGLYQNEINLFSVDESTAYDVFHYAFYMLSVVAIFGVLVARTIDNQSVLDKLQSE
ncbi:MAG: drug resistance transporter, EmrB/QacA subfamily [Gammaproteobacteria bacterium]|jgi:EmrB/QacA subfamily drug resistance transporter|nr:drug resistance transporter, EmrB/QacA subfamily [Gammaproteobacteria bacterium]